MGFLSHIGVKRRSGRYPWGSGKDPEQRGASFLAYVNKLKEQGLSDTEIANGLGISRTKLQARRSAIKAEKRAADAALAQRLSKKGMTNVAIGERMGINESSVRSLLDFDIQERANITVATANMLRDAVEKKGVIDVGAGVENHVGISRTKLNAAISLLEDDGYQVHSVYIQQLGTGKNTRMKVLAPPGMTYKEIYKNRNNIRPVGEFAFSDNGGRSYFGLKPIESINSKRILIRYREDGGADKDGVIELRRGVEDLNLGGSNYAQVRIGVNGTHYLKGMALHAAEKLPPGIDIIYNTNKRKGTPPEEVFKKMESDPDNPFGTVIKPKGQRRALNIVNEEGDWLKWSRNISSQILSKQSPALAKKQLDLARDLKQEEFDEIMKITNPVIRKALLKSFADDADSSAVHLKAAALPRQANKIILPIPSLKEGEIYAPTFNDGETVVLIRHPHGGTFEIPEVRVNNKNGTAREIMGNALDAIGIHPKVAQKLSGADFDGDTVIIIPNRNKDIQTSPTLKALKDFDTKLAYPPYDGMKTVDGGIYNAKTKQVDYGGRNPSKSSKQMKMGDVSNLITDMTIKGASVDEIARAVKHSMVVIDSEKHHLDYARSAIENGIAELKKKYQGSERAGASTLISKSSSEERVPQRKDSYRIDPQTGKKIFQETGATFVNAKGKTVPKTTKSTKMAEVEDAFQLSSGTKIEGIYAEYANNLKSMANKARKALLGTPNLIYSPTAKETYATEVASLKTKLDAAKRNAPHERQAQLLANSIVKMKKDSNPNLDASDLKKIKGQALEEARARAGAKKPKIVVTDKEWEAIQLGAISNSVLTQIVANMAPETLKARATPRTAYQMTDTKVAKAKAMLERGYTTAEIAASLGVSVSTVQETIK